MSNCIDRIETGISLMRSIERAHSGEIKELESRLAEKAAEVERLRNICNELKPLVHRIANWERNNGTASCLFITEESKEILEIVMDWAHDHSMRRIDEALSNDKS